jgi:PAT family beta-lactamase induction signal transducer AmpG
LFERLLESLKVYADPRILGIGFLGFSSGLPRLLVYSTLSFWLLEEGLSITAVGLFAATALPYNLKFAWAPLLDRVRLPIVTRLLGLRRGWMAIIQVALAAAVLALSTGDPRAAPVVVAAMALVVSFLSASQDVVIDAYRVEILDDEEQGAGAAAVVFGYRIGMLVASAGALYIAAWSESWPATYAVMAGLMAVGLVTTLLVREPASSESDDGEAPLVEEVRDAVLGPFRDFVGRRGMLLVLVFILLYKLGDALAGTMTNPLLVALEFEKTTIADVAKTFGLVASIVGVFAGGALVRRLGIVRALWVAGFLQMGSNLMFSVQAWVGRDVPTLVATIGIENLSGGLGTAAFVAYLSALCDRRYTATQYAFLTAAASSLKTVVSTGSGAAVEAVGWAPYFLLTTAAAAPGLVLLWWMQRRDWTGLQSQ